MKVPFNRANQISDTGRASQEIVFLSLSQSLPVIPDKAKAKLKVLAVDIGGTHVKILVTDKKQSRRFPSSPGLTAKEMVAAVRELAKDWQYDVVSIGYPGAVLHGKPVAESYALGDGWVGFDFCAACPVKVINDAAMQAIGSYEGKRMLGLGTGLGSAMIVDGVVEPMELGHLRYKKHTYEHYFGKRGLRRLGKKRWRQTVTEIIPQLIKALEPDYVVIGGGNARKLKKLPDKCRLGCNANAFKGGFLLWNHVLASDLVAGQSLDGVSFGASDRSLKQC